MANGYYGSKDEWNKMEACLNELAPIFREHAKKHNLKLEKHNRDLPSRTLDWLDNDIRKSISIIVEFEKEMSARMTLNLSASQDRQGKRYWKHDCLKKDIIVSEIKLTAREVLERAQSLVNSWGENELEFMMDLSEIEEVAKLAKLRNRQTISRLITAFTLWAAVAIIIIILFKLLLRIIT